MNIKVSGLSLTHFFNVFKEYFYDMYKIYVMFSFSVNNVIVVTWQLVHVKTCNINIIKF